MNIIPLVLSFLIILALTVSIFFSEDAATTLETKSFLGRMRIIQESRSLFELDLWDLHQKPQVEPPQPPAQAQDAAPKNIPVIHKARSEADKKRFEAKRKKRRSSSLSSFNLAFLEQHPHLFYQKTAVELLEKIYEGVPFFEAVKKHHPQIATEIITSILKTMKTMESDAHLEAILEKNPPHYDLMYKMLKGTHNYSLEDHVGYPPLSDFFSYEKENKMAIYFHFASIPLMSVLFGEKVKEEIFEKEEEKWAAFEKRQFLTKEEIEKLLNASFTGADVYKNLILGTCFINHLPKRSKELIIDPKSKVAKKQAVEYKEED